MEQRKNSRTTTRTVVESTVTPNVCSMLQELGYEYERASPRRKRRLTRKRCCRLKFEFVRRGEKYSTLQGHEVYVSQLHSTVNGETGGLGDDEVYLVEVHMRAFVFTRYNTFSADWKEHPRRNLAHRRAIGGILLTSDSVGR